MTKKKNLLSDQDGAKATQAALWRDHMTLHAAYRAAGRDDPFWPDMLERFEESTGEPWAADGPKDLPVEESPEAPEGNGKDRLAYILWDQAPCQRDDGLLDFRLKIGSGQPKDRARATTLPGIEIAWTGPGGYEKERELQAALSGNGAQIGKSEWYWAKDALGLLEGEGIFLTLPDLPEPEPEPAPKSAGRPPDTPTPSEVAFLIANPDMSWRALYSKYGWGTGKAKRFRAYASELAAQIN